MIEWSTGTGTHNMKGHCRPICLEYAPRREPFQFKDVKDIGNIRALGSRTGF